MPKNHFEIEIRGVGGIIVAALLLIGATAIGTALILLIKIMWGAILG